jgi:hypothetical protein
MSRNPTPVLRPEKGRSLRRLGLRSFYALLVLAGLYVATLLYPQLFFDWVRGGAAIELRSDEPIPDSALTVLAGAEAKVRRSALFDPKRVYPVHVCNSGWRWSYFSGFDGRSRAFETFMGRAVFTRRARWSQNQLTGADGSDGPRPLDAYIAHEVTHMMVSDHLGILSTRRLPVWLREGYAEYVARRGTFDYEATRARLLAGDDELVSRLRDPYLKYLLLVTHLLEREGWSERALLRDPPKVADVEARVRSGAR